jgi:ergothioneine biosynthesis protein EgtB
VPPLIAEQIKTSDFAPTHALLERYKQVRAATEVLCEPLSAEDCTVQSMPDASPAKWHLAHITWYFETFVLEAQIPGYQRVDDEYRVLFNSYYNLVGPQHPRPHRGLLTRPSLQSIFAYRSEIDRRMCDLLDGREELGPELSYIIELGLNHEQQHQELLLMDIKHLLSLSPLYPAYRTDLLIPSNTQTSTLRWHDYSAGEYATGHDGKQFCFDNELPRHNTLVQDFSLASRLTTNGEYLAFIEDGGYARPEMWLSDGWTTIAELRCQAPFYWRQIGGHWFEYTLGGLADLHVDAPVAHLSYYEADAYASWAQARLPRESEWELAASRAASGAATGVTDEAEGNFLETDMLLPAAPAGRATDAPQQMLGDLWEWTQSAYSAYPGYRAPEGAVGEYNGKFMANQYVLRGGACITPRSHIRKSYRNFFYPHTHWHFSGLRLARDGTRV